MIDQNLQELIERMLEDGEIGNPNMELTQKNLGQITKSNLTEENLKKHNQKTTISSKSAKNLSDLSRKGGYCTIS